MLRRFNEREEKIMTILWDIKNGYVQDIIKQFPKPKPHYNTVSSTVRKLEKEGHIGHRVKQRAHQYFPITKKKAYRSLLFGHLYSTYFNDSKNKFLHYVVEKTGIKKLDLRSYIKKN